MAAHPEQFEREALKLALGVHTRSTRYLQAVAAGQPRHDLQGQSVEPMAPEHVHHALWELYRRRQERGGDEWRAKIRTRMARAIDASGLTRDDYCARVHIRDAQAQALLDEALAELAAQHAREEALLHAFEASGQTVEAFADMYGMDPRTAERNLQRARQRKAG
jgi:ProP effector